MIKSVLVLALALGCQVAAGSDINASISGFISGTLVSDPDFYKHSAKGAINLDITKDTYALHAQLASSVEFPTESLLSRVTLEKTFEIARGQEVSVVIGRAPRLYSLFNAITDNVGTSGLAMLPLSQYKRRYVTDSRMISGDGIQLNYHYHEDEFSVEVAGGVSQASKINSCMVHMEFYNKPCGYAYGYESDNPNFDLIAIYEDSTLKFLAAIIHINIKSYITDMKDPVALATYTGGNRFSHRLYKLGFIKNFDNWWVMAEGTYRDIQKAEIKKDLEPYNRQLGGDVIVGYHFNDDISGYVGYSASGSSKGHAYGLSDNFVGATYANGDGFTYSLEYHVGRGRDWNRYLSPDDNWSSAVFSISKQF